MADNSTDDMIIAIGVDVATIRRGLKKLEQEVASSTGKVQKQFETVGRGIDNAMTSAMQNRINAMVGIGTKGAKEWTGALADQGKELERLRAKYSPLFATINNYKSAVADIRRAHAVGAISADEMTSAIQRERQAALASTAAIKGRNAALAQGGSLNGASARGFQTANIAAQFQDIGVTAAMGMNPLQIALQQGTQLSAVFNQMGSGKQVLAGLGAAFASIVNPISLVTIGLIAGGAAAIQYFSTLEWGGAKSEETLKREAELVAGVVAKWGDALPALKAYNDERQRIAGDKELAEALEIGKSAQWDDLRKQIADVNVEFTALKTDIQQSSDNVDGIVALQKAFNDLQSRIDKGTATAADAKRVQDALAGFISETGIPTIADFAKQFDILAAAIANASGKAKTFDVDEIIRTTSRFPSRGAYGGVTRNADGTPQGEGMPLPFNGPTPERRPLIELDGLPGADKADKKQETAAQKAANAYRDLIKSADDRIGQLRLETELTGQYGVATDAARFRLELLQQAEDKGRSLSATQKAEIEGKVALYEKYSQALAETKLQQDLLNQARFSSLSKQDQQIVTTLRQYGLSEDLGGKNAQAIRQSLRSEEIKEGVSTFLGDFKNALLENGGDIGEAFGKALLNSLMNSMNKQWETIFDTIGSTIAASLTGKSAVGGGAASPFSATTTLGALLGVGGTGAGTSASGGMATYRAAISAIESGGRYDALGPVTRNGDRAFGKYQMMGNNIGPWSEAALGRRLSSSEFLANPSLQDQIFDHRFGGYVDKFGPSGAAQAWFGGPGSVGKGGMGADILGTSGNQYVKMFETNIAKMGSVAGEATKGLGGLNGGLQAIAQNFGGAGAGGFNIGSLFSSGFKPNTTLGNFLQGIPGFDGGGNTGMGARAGGLDGKGGFLALMHPRETVTDHTKVNAPRAPRLNASGGPRMVRNESSMTVHISGASGDDHVRMLVRQGVQTALRDQNENMRRQGFGNIQDAYNTDRG